MWFECILLDHLTSSFSFKKSEKKALKKGLTLALPFGLKISELHVQIDPLISEEA